MSFGNIKRLNDDSVTTFLSSVELMVMKPSRIYNTIHMYSGITSGRVLNGKLLYTKILEVNMSR